MRSDRILFIASLISFHANTVAAHHMTTSSFTSKGPKSLLSHDKHVSENKSWMTNGNMTEKLYSPVLAEAVL